MKRLLASLAILSISVGASAADFPPVRVEKINERVYALLGPTAAPNRENRGYMNNNLAIIGKQGVILVDAGSHKQAAEHIQAALRMVTPKPVTHVVITHYHSDHHLGLSAFGGVNVIATDVAAREIRDKGRGMLNWMKVRSGLPLADTQPVTPQTLVPARSRQSIEVDGVRMELIATETAHTQGDLMLWLPEDGVLASGDILVNTVNPNFADGDIKKLVGVVDSLLQLPLKTVMPGHGPLMSRQEVDGFRQLVHGFYQTVLEIYKSGGVESDVRKKLDLARWQKLDRFEDMMGQNISAVWRQVEADNF